MRETSLQAETNGCSMKGSGYCPRPLEKAAIFLSKKWTLSIIVTIGNFGTMRFNDLRRRIGMTQKTLSERLRELEQYNLVMRRSFQERPPHVEYSLTSKGEKVRKAVVPLLRLAESNVFIKG
ncbi:MAG: helix-turn-helix transcriptional regulator [Candidatus Aenigmarchaeota archaeon]|nr:helix-turn-helix transcriptional regulator [Candidatus Aenigmarchaeota archaeon]